MVHKTADERRAMVDAKHGEELLKAEESAAKFLAMGQPPKKSIFSCFGAWGARENCVKLNLFFCLVAFSSLEEICERLQFVCCFKGFRCLCAMCGLIFINKFTCSLWEISYHLFKHLRHNSDMSISSLNDKVIRPMVAWSSDKQRVRFRGL